MKIWYWRDSLFDSTYCFYAYWNTYRRLQRHVHFMYSETLRKWKWRIQKQILVKLDLCYEVHEHCKRCHPFIVHKFGLLWPEMARNGRIFEVVKMKNICPNAQYLVEIEAIFSGWNFWYLGYLSFIFSWEWLNARTKLLYINWSLLMLLLYTSVRVRGNKASVQRTHSYYILHIRNEQFIY